MVGADEVTLACLLSIIEGLEFYSNQISIIEKISKRNAFVQKMNIAQ